MDLPLRTGRSWTSSLGLGRIRQQFSKSQAAPSKYRPLTKQPGAQRQMNGCCVAGGNHCISKYQVKKQAIRSFLTFFEKSKGTNQ